jgi:RimK family alpha-L-glutamate ligase
MAVRVLPVPPREPAATVLRSVRQALVVGSTANATNVALESAFADAGFDARVVDPEQPAGEVEAGDLVLSRVDVRPTLDGPCAGLWETAVAERAGAILLNRPRSLYLAHDKLATATVLAQAGVPHPLTVHVAGADVPRGFASPCVLKPRFGSWGRDVFLCRDRQGLQRALAEVADRGWFLEGGALVQERVGTGRDDLRVLVAAGAAVGAVRRIAGPGEWRTNVAAGGRRAPASLDPGVFRLAVRAVAALGLDFAGVDLIRDAAGGWVVLEVNGAVDFTEEYSLNGTAVHEQVIHRLVERVPLPMCRSR